MKISKFGVGILWVSFDLMCSLARSSKLAVTRIRPNENSDDAKCGDTTAANPSTTAVGQTQLGEVIIIIL